MLGFVAIVLVVIFYSSTNSRLKKIENKVFGSIVSGVNPAVDPIKQNVPFERPEVAEQVNSSDLIAPILQNSNTINVPNNLPAEKNALEKFITWLSDEWPLKVGIFLLILAVGWFVTYAFMNDWIGEVGRISLGTIFGVIILLLGFYRASSHQIQGNALLVLGSTSVLISIISGIGLYHLFPASVALIVAFVLTVFMIFVAWNQKNSSLAIVTLLMGSIVPVFVFASLDISIIFLYLFVLSAGTLWITSKTGWASLNIMSLAVVFLYSIAYDNFKGFSEDYLNLMFAFAFIFLFYISNIATILYKKIADNYDLAVAGGTGILFLIWMSMIAPADMLVYLIIFGALLFAIGSYIIFILTKSKNPIIIYVAVSIMLLVNATAIEFKGWELMVAYIIELSLFTIVNLFLRRKQGYAKNSLDTFGMILYAILLFFSVDNIYRILQYLNDRHYNGSKYYSGYYSDRLQTVDITTDLIILFLMGIMAFIITIVAVQLFYKDNKPQGNIANLVCFYAIVGGFYTTLLIWIITHLVIETETIATILSLVIYTLAGVFFYVMGKRNNHGFYKSIGGILLGVVLFRLFFFEFANMDMVGKIVAFFVVGVLFVSTTFMGRKNKISITEDN